MTTAPTFGSRFRLRSGQEMTSLMRKRRVFTAAANDRARRTIREMIGDVQICRSKGFASAMIHRWLSGKNMR